MKKIILFSTCSLFLFSLPVFAKPDIQLKLESKKVIKKDNKEEFVDASQAKPGDILLYTITVSNKGDSKAIEVEPEGDIPKNTVYVVEKADIKYPQQFSIDGGKTYFDKPTIKEKKDGKEITKDAPLDRYNKIKWMIKSLDAKKSLIFKYKVKVK
ncbi:MAG: hypothetical protein AABZ74_12775 [Cyanobacteriota bacterium]